MKKVLFLMFLLFLGLGTANVNAQVRIGGNTAPNAAAALDLNATDATNNGTKGLALPRVNLTSNTMQLTSGVTNLTGMLVYNTTTTLGAVGIYVWNGTNWIKVNLPSTTAADSGKFLKFNGVSWTAMASGWSQDTTSARASMRDLGAVTWTKVLDTVLWYGVRADHFVIIPTSGIGSNDMCMTVVYGHLPVWASSSVSGIVAGDDHGQGVAYHNWRIRCYRPSI